MKNENKSIRGAHITSSSGSINDRWCLHHYDTEEEGANHIKEMKEDGYKVIRFEKSNLTSSYNRDEKWIAEFIKQKMT